MQNSLRIARMILNGFESYFAEFQNITLAAKKRFETADWMAVHAESGARIDLYKKKVQEVVVAMHFVAGDELTDKEFWIQSKNCYANLIVEHNNFEIAETFFNSTYCSVFSHDSIRNSVAFVFSSREELLPWVTSAIYRVYALDADLKSLFAEILSDYRFDVPYEDFNRDVDFMVESLKASEAYKRIDDSFPTEVHVLNSLFFRNKGAYLVAKLVSGNRTIPIVVPFFNNESGGIYVDTLISTVDEVSIIFSFTRSYFMVDALRPSEHIGFLKSLMPNKDIPELYNSLGHNKHGKTEFVRYAVQHMSSSTDKFEIAPGIKGMVMSVFTMPSYDYVFKVIKDRFTPPKDMTREEVKQKYRLVKRHDRAGRMADTQEFKNLVFDKLRFSDELMAELQAVAPSLIEIRDNALILKHVYVERRMVPLNLYLRTANEEQTVQVMDEYGNAIKQLAAANIFPGDMLLKNFGVTRHGRVVFYDYDELCPLTDCNFRKIPPPRNEFEEMSDQPWYTVAENDIFPEEFRLFFSGNQQAKKAFDGLHSDIYDVFFWQGLQNKIREGYVEDFFPYRRRRRFARESQ